MGSIFCDTILDYCDPHQGKVCGTRRGAQQVRTLDAAFDQPSNTPLPFFPPKAKQILQQLRADWRRKQAAREQDPFAVDSEEESESEGSDSSSSEGASEIAELQLQLQNSERRARARGEAPASTADSARIIEQARKRILQKRCVDAVALVVGGGNTTLIMACHIPCRSKRDATAGRSQSFSSRRSESNIHAPRSHRKGDCASLEVEYVAAFGDV